jgi:hypothetical protein
VYSRLLVAAALVVTAAAAAANGQDKPPAATEPCELHIWPAKENLAVIQYNQYSLGRDRPFIRPGGRPTPQPLDRQRQIALLSALDPAELGLPRATVVRHLEPVDRLEASRPVRHSSSAAPCQGEILVGSFIYESHVYSKRSLRLLVAFRRFEGQRAEPTWSFSTYASAKLIQFPAKRAEDVEAANADLERAYVEAVHSFISYQQKAFGRAAGPQQ